MINSGDHPLYDAPEAPYGVPSYATVRRAVHAAESLASTSLRHGKTYASAKWQGGGEGLEAIRPLQLGIIDHTRLPCVVVDPEREIVLGPVWLTILVDVFCRAILGWVVSFNSPSLWSVGEVLRRANRPKRPPSDMLERYPGLRTVMGRSSELILDNAKEFTGHGMEAIAGGSGMVVRHCPMGQPRFRGTGERMFDTIKTKLLDNLPNAKMPVGWSRIANYDAEDGAVTTIDDIEAAMNHIIAEIHTEPSDALDRRTPLQMFEKGTHKHGIDVWWDADASTRELQEVATDVQLSKSGIRKFGMRYFDAKLVSDLLDNLIPLEPRRQRREDATVTVSIRFDPSDISVIHVWNRHTKRFVTLKCDEPTYAKGMPRWLHSQIRDAAKSEGEAFNTEMERLRARDRRIEAIRNIKPTSTKAERTQFGKLLEIPRQNQVRGNIVEVEDVEPKAVTLADFIYHDVASLTSLDAQILSPRKPYSEGAGERKFTEATTGQDRTANNGPARNARRRSSRQNKKGDEG
ncbi:MAG: transposase family protein [Nitrobacter sp.]|nr:transposase family protein [Nitrobacter sp.]